MKSYIEQLKSDIEDQKKNLKKAEEELRSAEKFSEGLKKIKKLEMKPLLNGHENIVFKMLCSCMDNNKYILWSQVSFSAFLKNDKTEDWWEYNKYYVDFLFVEKNDKKPCLVVEYMGSIKHREYGYVYAKDRFREAICQKAGLSFVELEKMENVEDKQQLKEYESYIKEKLKDFGVLRG